MVCSSSCSKAAFVDKCIAFSKVVVKKLEDDSLLEAAWVALLKKLCEIFETEAAVAELRNELHLRKLIG